MKQIIYLITLVLISLSCGEEYHSEFSLKTLKKSTFLGLSDRKGEKIVHYQLEGGCPVLRFLDDEFYYYFPQEGMFYHISEIHEISDGFKIMTNGYYFMKGENIIKEEAIWYLKKEKHSLWSFRNAKWKDKVLMSDSLDLKKNRIEYRVEEKRIRTDSKKSNTVPNPIDFDYEGTFSVDCIATKSCFILHNNISGYLDIYQGDELARIIVNPTKNGQLAYGGLTGITRGNEFANWDDISRDSAFCKAIPIDQNKIEITWLGFYNLETKKREIQENPFNSSKIRLILIRCER